MLSNKTKKDIFNALRVRKNVSQIDCDYLIEAFEKYVEHLKEQGKGTPESINNLFETTFGLDSSYMDY